MKTITTAMVRDSAALLYDIFEGVDISHDENGQVSRAELTDTLEGEGYDRGRLVDTPHRVLNYAYYIGGSQPEPSLDSLKKALDKSVEAVEKRAAMSGDAGVLSTREYSRLPKTAKALALFAEQYANASADSLFW